VNKYSGVIAKARNGARNQVFLSTKALSYSDGHLIFDYGDGGSKPVYSVAESIAYANGGRFKANFCIHKKLELHSPAGPVMDTYYYSAASPTVTQRWYQVGDYTRVNLLPAAKTAFDTSLGGLSLEENYLGVNGIGLMTSNWDKLQPTLEELSVPNFLIDLHQIKGLFKLWNLRRTLTQNFANLNLSVQFGWKPLLGDIKAMVAAVSNLQRKIKTWNDSLGKLVTHRCKVLGTDIVKSGTLSSGEFDVDWRGTVTQEAHCYIKFRPLPIVALNDLDLQLRGTLASLGFNLNARIVWDAIPFSFVVDWVFNVGGLLNNLRIDTLELPFVLVDTFAQYKESYRVEVTPKLRANTDHTGWTFGSGNLYERKTFHRMHCAPSFQSFIEHGWKFPSYNQIGLALSLGSQRGR
jgi:hypothetical protein